MKTLIEKIHQAQSLILTTHKQCDGDGLGAELAIYHALKKMGKNVRIINVDSTPRKYRYLEPNQFIQYHDSEFSPIEKTDLALVFDTNDHRLVEPLYSDLKKHCTNILFVDHHPALKDGPKPTEGSWINIEAASTGEMAFDLIQALEISLDKDICRAIYTSIVFDTQLFRFVRDSSRSHEIAAILLKYNISPDEVHRYLFSDYTTEKVAFLSTILGHIEYFDTKRLAVLKIRTQDLLDHNLKPEEARDVIDMIMNIECLEGAVLFREDAPDEYKVSLRSKGRFPVLPIAETLEGGGHQFAAGAYIRGPYEQLKTSIIKHMTSLLSNE